MLVSTFFKFICLKEPLLRNPLMAHIVLFKYKMILKQFFSNTLPKQIFYLLSSLCHRSVCMFVAGHVWESGGRSGGPSQGNSGAAGYSWGPSLGKPSSAERAVHACTDHLAQLCSGLLINMTTQVQTFVCYLTSAMFSQPKEQET